MGSKLYREIGEKLPSICPGITIRQFRGEVEYKQVDDHQQMDYNKLLLSFYEDYCRYEDLNLDLNRNVC